MSAIPRSLEQLSQDLQLIGGLSSSQVLSVKELLSGRSDRIERPETLVVAASKTVEIEIAEAIVRQLLHLQNASRRTGYAVTELTENQTALIEQHFPKDSAELAIRIQGLSYLNELSCVRAIANTAKAIELSYDSDNLLQHTRILTDVRPLFSEDAQSIDGAIVAHTLRLRYDSAGVDHELSLALDISDLRRLIEDCERALLKEQTAQKKLCKPANVPSMQSPQPSITQED
jgi:hypothetical protein